MSLIIEFISAFVLVFCEILSWFNIKKTVPQTNSYRIYFVAFVLSFFQIINYHYASGFVKSLGIIITFILACLFLFGKNLKECFIISFLCELTVIISETLVVLILYIIFGLDISSVGNIYLTFIIDILVGIMVFLITKINIYNKVYNYLVHITSNLKSSTILWSFLFIMIGASAIFTSLYLRENVILVLVINISIFLIYTFIVIHAFKSQNNFYKERIRYSNSLEILKSQEEIINDYRISNHENKNQLMTIRAMTTNKKITNYIETVLNQKQSFNYDILKMISKIPQGGMRALIYNKLVYMNDNNIKSYLHIDKNISSKILLNISTDDMVDICQILGVFIDNAIEETIMMKENGLVNIKLHKDNNSLVISIINNCNICDNSTNLISNKGKGRGYGLQLVKRIINRNSRLSNEREISKGIFVQRLIIKIK